MNLCVLQVRSRLCCVCTPISVCVCVCMTFTLSLCVHILCEAICSDHLQAILKACKHTLQVVCVCVCLSVGPAVPGVRQHDCVHATFAVRAAVRVAAAGINPESW